MTWLRSMLPAPRRGARSPALEPLMADISIEEGEGGDEEKGSRSPPPAARSALVGNDYIDSCGFVASYEGLRGVSIVTTMVAHISGVFPFNEAIGSVGVASFFVLSGFLVTGMLIKGVERQVAMQHGRAGKTWGLTLGHLPRFYADRAVRLLPPLLFCLAAVSIYWLQTGADPQYVFYNAWRALLNLQNTSIGQQPYGATPFGNTWSLAVEEQYYALWSLAFPLFYWASQRVRMLLLLAVVAVSVYTRFETYNHPGSMYGFDWHYSLPANLFKMVIGSSLRLVPVPRLLCSRLAGYIGLAGLFAVSWACHSQFYDALAWSDTLATLCTIPIITGVLPDGNIFLDCAPVRFLGRVSYSWYIWQNPILITNGNYGKYYPAFTDSCFAFVLALFSTFYLEEPLRNMYRRHRPA